MMKWPAYGIHPHGLGDPCSSRCISTEGGVKIERPRESGQSTYGIRPHMLTAEVSMSWQWKLSEANRPAVELMFDLCTLCKERRRSCTCYERGYN